MNKQAYQEIVKMLNSFPKQATTDIRGLLLTYDEDTTGIPDEAIIEAAQRFRRGLVADQNMEYAPSVATFCAEARQRQEIVDLRSRPRLPAPMVNYRPGPMSAFMVRQQRALSENADCPVILENASLEDFKRMSKAGELPVGSRWVAILAIIFGPRQSSNSTGRAAA